MLSDDDIRSQVLNAFRAEQAEHRQAAGELLLELERDPHHPERTELLNQLFREAHSLKGGARAAGLTAIEQLAHCIEDLFAAARDGRIELTPSVCDPVYAALDTLGVLMARYDAGETPDLSLYQGLIDNLAEIVAAARPAPDAAPSIKRARPAPDQGSAPAPAEPGAATAGEEQAPARSARLDDVTTVRLSTAVLDGLLNEASELMTSTLRARQLASEAADIASLPARWRRTWQRLGPTMTRLRAAPSVQPVVHHLGDRGAAGAEPGQGIALELLADALEQANTLIGELGDAVAHLSRQAAENHSHLAAVAERLQAQVRRTRMLPLATLVPPLRLQLREMARSAGKRASLVVDDGGAEADRQVLDQLRDVLLHLLRNAVDHGIEAPSLRAAAGKAEAGTITLRAAASGDQLRLTLADDGAGIDLEAVRQRALAAGLIAPGEASLASEAELLDLIFLPGFSTRQAVNELSGRGVGLDVVRTNVERMHGRVRVETQAGQGTTFSITVPLSLTRSQGLLVRAGAGEYVLPLDAVQRILAVEPGQIAHLEGRAVLHLDGRPLPLASLAELLGAGQPAPNPSLALLMSSGERQAACLIDAVLGEQELVIHRLPAPLRRVRFVGGATILADGRVLPLLDMVDLVRAAAGARSPLPSVSAPAPERRAPVILVADDSITTRTLERNILEAAGYRVRLATDGQEALDMLRQMVDDGGCDLLLSDIDMPRLNGFELTRQVRADARLRHLPIVLVTSLDSPADRERGVTAGADAYIVKRAFDQQVLLDTVARLL